MIQAHQSQLAEMNNVFVRDSDNRHKDHQAQLTALEKHHTRAMATAAADSADALECALRISRKGAWINVHIHANSGDRERTPTGQVKRQAALLRSYLKARGIECNWIDTCVYYSHPNGQTYLRSHDRTITLIGDKKQLRQWIRSRCVSARPPASDELIRALEEISFDRANVVRRSSH